MPRQRTGTMSFDAASGSYRVRVTITNPDGTTSRPWYSLNTAVEATAKQRRDALLAKLAEAPPTQPPQRFEPYALAWWEARQARGLAQAASEIGWLRNHILPAPAPGAPAMGGLYLVDIKPAHVRAVIEAALAKKMARQTIKHVRQTMHRVLAQAWRDDLIPFNPVDKVLLPQMREVQRQRAILTDAEIATLFACERVSVEIRILVLAARTAGGARTIDLTVWDWTMIDIDAFAWCIIARTKTKKPQKLEIPNVLRGPLRAWWETHGSPSSGPVFPATKGPRAGKARRLRGTTFAHRLRRALLVAGITRHELHHDTEWSRRVDFHSCRRAFATALAEQHVDPRTAMALTGHSDPKVHERYVLLTQATRVPEAALPRLPADAAALIRPGIVRTAGAANENAEQRRASGACSVSSRS